MAYATFDGTGANYYTRTVLPALTAYPFFVIVDVQAYERLDYSTAYTMWAAERAAGGHGTAGFIFQGVPIAHADNGTSSGEAKSVEASLQKPYADKVLYLFVSATDRRVYIDGVLEKTNNTNISIDLSTGSPVLRIGIRAAGSDPMFGSMANWACGTGTPTSNDIALLSSPNVNYSTISLTGGTMTNWYKLNGNGNDSIGGANLTTVGTITYTTGTLASPNPPGRNEVIQWALMQPNLTADVPTITANQTPPAGLGIDGSWTNFAGCDYYDVSFTGNCGAWNTRAYLIRCTTPSVVGRHIVFQDGGHAVQSEWASYRDSVVIKAMSNAGYDVMVTQLPLEGPTDPGYSGSAQLHDSFYADFVPNTKNPMERWVRLNSSLMTSIIGTYGTRSIIGLSGGAGRAAYIGAIDPRFNHAIVVVRGALPHRRMIGDGFDFEQRTHPLGYKYEELFRLCANGNRRLFISCAPNDTCCFDQFVDITGAPLGAYLDATSLDTNFLAPIRAQNPYADIQFIVDLGPDTHSWTDYAISNIVLPALSTGLTTVYYADKVLAGTNYKPEFFTQRGAPAWYDDIVYSGSSGIGVSIALSGVQGTGAVGAFDIPKNITLPGVQGTGSVGAFGQIISSNVTLDSLRGIGRIGHFVGLGPKGGVPGSGLGVKLGLGL